MSGAAAIADPCAFGHFANLPPDRWACARAGSKGQKKNLIYLSALLFPLHGTSSDVPLVRYTQIIRGTTTFAELLARQALFPVAPCLQQHTRQSVCMRRGRRMSLSRSNFENYTVVASALVAESGRRARLKPGCPNGRAGSNPAERTRWVSTYTQPTGVVGEIVYHSWLLPLSSGFESRAAHHIQRR